MIDRRFFNIFIQAIQTKVVYYNLWPTSLPFIIFDSLYPYGAERKFPIKIKAVGGMLEYPVKRIRSLSNT